MSNVSIDELNEVVAQCVTEELNEWLEDCSTEELAVAVCVARARRKALQEIANAA